MKNKRILMSVAMAALMLVSICAVGASTLSVSAAQGSSSYVQAPTVVGMPVGSGAPAACSVDGTSLDLFIRGGDNHLYLKIAPDGTTWPSTSTYLGGGLTSAPAATVRDTNKVTVFVRGDDGAIHYRDGSQAGLATTWGYWTSIGGKTAAGTALAVCSWGGGRLDVFVKGADGLLWHKSYTSTAGWADHWDSLGGTLASGPAATATSDGGNEIGVFVVGVNGPIFYKHYTSSGWGSWITVGGKALAGTSPAAYNWGASHIGWLVTGTDYQLYHNWVGKSTGYDVVGGVLTSSPAATAKANGIIDAFGRGSTGTFAALYQDSYNYGGSGEWGGWTAIGGV